MKNFNDIQFKQHPLHTSGIIGRMFFPNGYGVSVVKHPRSYGGSEGLYEVAILSKNGKLNYNTPLTSDVIGYLTQDDVDKLLIQVQQLRRWKVFLINLKKSILGK